MTNDDHDILLQVKTILDSINLRLFGGDGTRGELGDVKERTTNLEDFKSRLTGALVLLSFLVSIIGGTLIYHLFNGK